MLAAVILITEIDFYENQRGAAEITEDSIAPYQHGIVILFYPEYRMNFLNTE